MRLPATALAVLLSAALIGCGGGEETREPATAPAPATQTAAAAAGLQTVGVEEAAAAVDAGDALLVDVREDDEWEAGHAPDAVHVPLAEVPEQLDELDERRGEDALIFICRSGNRSAEAAQAATDAGLEDVLSVDGGMNDWVSAGLPLEPTGGTVL